MVQELNYNSTSLVIESWEELRRIENYEEVAGAILFKNLFKKSPAAQVLFGFPLETTDLDSPDLLKSKRFIMHSSYLIQMLDTALNMLGPDVELLTDIMAELGTKHVRYGVKAEMFPVMGEALMIALRETLGTAFTAEREAAWKEIYDELSSDMIHGRK